MRLARLLLLTGLVGVAMAPVPQPPASASCAGPSLEDVRALHRGQTTTVEGRGFVDGCQDSMSCTVGCAGSCESDTPPETPMEQVTHWLVQGPRSWILEVSDAGTAEDDRLGRVTWTFTVPEGATPGPARLVADRAGPERVRIG